MRVSKSRPCRTLVQLFAFMSAFHHTHALSQEYCSSENTGSDYSAVTNIYQSNGACQETCVDSYAFAVVQYQSCWCSNYAPADQVDVSQCNTACPGYPDESCGNSDDGLYGYIALSISPSGTAGGSSSSASSTSASSASSASSTQQTTSSSSMVSSSSETSQDTVYSSVSVTVYSTVQQSPSVVVSYVTLSSSTSSTSSTPSSTTSSSSSSPTTTSSSISSIVTTSELAVTTPTSDASSVHTTFVSTQVLTVSGAEVTQTVTSTAMVASDSQDGNLQRKGISTGTVAGAVVGSIVGVALLLIGAFFLWRRKRSDPAAETRSTTSSSARRKMERNTSVLSKTGLLSSAGPSHDLEKSPHDGPGFISTSTNKRNSAMYGGSGGPSPVSPSGAGAFDDSSQRSRRNSRPLVYDQRLNPTAIMQNWEANGSRASIGTMQDQRDYSRPLGVTNPDPVDD